MNLIYLSTDELNTSLVRTWATRAGHRVECPIHADRATELRHDAALLDADHAHPRWLADLLARVDSLGGSYPVAAHGYGTSLDELRRRGVIVYPRLCPEILRELAGAMASSVTIPISEGANLR